MIQILNKRTNEVYIIHNANKSEATKTSFINREPVTKTSLSNWHALYSHRILLHKQGKKAVFQFLLEDHLEVII